ncbi:ankyrin repeat-containing domain protein, partial [Xylariales sp. AK1849]
VEKRDRLTALHLAASLGLCGIVQMLVNLGASPNHSDRFGVTALHYAADFGCANCVNILVSAGAKVDLDAPKMKITTALWYAAKNGKAAAVKALLHLGAHIYTQASTAQDTILYAAVDSGSLQVCEALLGGQANPSEGFDLLALATSRSKDVLACLVKAGADVNMKDPNQETLLHQHVTLGHAATVAFLLSLGANPGVVDGSSRTPLHLAMEKGGLANSPTLVKILLDSGANPNVQNALGQTPLHLAVLWGRADVALVLCEAGASLTVVDQNGLSPWAETQKHGYE